MTLFIIPALFCYAGMLVHACVCKKDITCLSDIAYDKHKALFPVLMAIISFCLFLAMIDKVADNYQFLCFMAMVGCCGVGVTPYKDSDYTSVHYFFAIMAMVCMYGLWFQTEAWYMPFLFCLAGLRKHWLLGIEMGILASAFAYCLI